MYFLETEYCTISVHLSLAKANEALRQYWLTDTTGTTAYITESSVDTMMYVVGTFILFAIIGGMLAWRG